MSKGILEKLTEAKNYIVSKIGDINVDVGIVLGTGLGNLGDIVEDKIEIDVCDIPNFPVSTVETHKGKLIVGNIFGKNVAVLQGRVHLYEGYDPKDVCFGVRVLGLLGIKILILTNAAGAINPNFEECNIMVITDHINFTGKNPLVGKNIEELGERFPDMSAVYDKDLIKLAIRCGEELNIRLEKGVYIGVLGPSLETPAETRALRILGADAVGMSTVMEAIAARHMGLKVLGLSCLTNKNLPDCMKETSFEDVVKNANKAGATLEKLICEILKKI